LNPRSANSRRIGIRVVCSGTTSRPTMKMKKRLRPGKFIQLNAYAANAATRTGMIVAGIVMNRLLTKASNRLLWDRIAS
jgi:hypothetical protein